MPDDYKNLGEMNGWREYPPEYTACHEAEHKIESRPGAWRCYTHYSCPICKIKWAVDSSD
jgi:hypothetical protein